MASLFAPNWYLRVLSLDWNAGAWRAKNAHFLAQKTVPSSGTRLIDDTKETAEEENRDKAAEEGCTEESADQIGREEEAETCAT